MKKIILFTFLMVNSLLLTGCLPVIQGASTVNSVVSVSNDRRSAGTILDDKTLYFKLAAWSMDDAKTEDAHLNFLIYDKMVLIAGEASTNEMLPISVNKHNFKHRKLSKFLTRSKLGPTVVYSVVQKIPPSPFKLKHYSTIRKSFIQYTLGS